MPRYQEMPTLVPRPLPSTDSYYFQLAPSKGGGLPVFEIKGSSGDKVESSSLALTADTW